MRRLSMNTLTQERDVMNLVRIRVNTESVRAELEFRVQWIVQALVRTGKGKFRLEFDPSRLSDIVTKAMEGLSNPLESVTYT